MLRMKLIECGWRDELQSYCRSKFWVALNTLTNALEIKSEMKNCYFPSILYYSIDFNIRLVASNLLQSIVFDVFCIEKQCHLIF